jgi:hypothetical protein
MSAPSEWEYLAGQFLSLPPEAREVFINRLAECAAASEIIPIFEHFHKNLLEE